MQASMWLVLAGTVGLAALVDGHLERALYPAQTDPIVDGPITFRLPRSGPIKEKIDGASSVHSVTNNEAGWSLTVVRQHLDVVVPPLEYLQLSKVLGENRLGNSALHKEEIDGWPAVWVGGETVRNTPEGYEQSQSVTYCTVLPTRDAVMVRLESSEAIDHAELRVVHQALDSIRVAMTPAAAPIVLEGGARVTLPEGFDVYCQDDVLQKDRTIVAHRGDVGWVSAQFVPMLLGGDRIAAAKTAIGAYEHFSAAEPALTGSWLGAQVTEEAPGRWRITPAQVPGDLTRRWAYVLGGKRSEGLIVVLTAASPANEQDINQAWSALDGKIQMGQAIEPAAMFAAGTRASQGMQFTPTAGENWWLWSRGSQSLGWTREFNNLTNGESLRDTIMRNWEGGARKIAQDCWPAENGSGIIAEMIRQEATLQPSVVVRYRFQQRTILAGDATNTRIDFMGTTSQPLSWEAFGPAIVPSNRLPTLLAHLDKEPAAIWTDRFWGLEGELMAAPLLLATHPISSPNPALRGVEVEAEGTGICSQWFFKSDNTLDHANFPGDVVLTPNSKDQVSAQISGDSELAAVLHGRGN